MWRLKLRTEHGARSSHGRINKVAVRGCTSVGLWAKSIACEIKIVYDGKNVSWRKIQQK